MVTRYDFDAVEELVPMDDGRYVLYEDYAEIEARMSEGERLMREACEYFDVDKFRAFLGTADSAGVTRE